MNACAKSACLCSLGLVARVLGFSSPQSETVADRDAFFAQVVLEPCQLSKDEALEAKALTFTRFEHSDVFSRHWYICQSWRLSRYDGLGFGTLHPIVGKNSSRELFG
jgi:hypothetical protein